MIPRQQHTFRNVNVIIVNVTDKPKTQCSTPNTN